MKKLAILLTLIISALAIALSGCGEHASARPARNSDTVTGGAFNTEAAADENTAQPTDGETAAGEGYAEYPTDGEGNKGAVRDAHSNETSAPDTTAPGTSAPDTTAPETGAPDTTAPETGAPDTGAPDTTTPGTSAPETGTPGTSAPETDVPTRSSFEREVARLVNEIRRENGLSELVFDEELSRIARLKSQDMHDLGYFDHTSPTYGSPFDMMKSFGITYRAAGENIAYGYRTPEAVVDGWMNSPGHRANILDRRYRRIGIGYVADGNYWTQMFTG